MDPIQLLIAAASLASAYGGIFFAERLLDRYGQVVF